MVKNVQISVPATELEVAYLQSTTLDQSALPDLLIKADLMNQEGTLTTSMLPEVPVLTIVQQFTHYPVYYSRFKLNEFVNSYTRNVFYVFVTTLAP